MINSGDKNVNVVDIINTLKGHKYPTNDGVDDYTMNEPYQQYPRDSREHNPLDIINTDEIKPLDSDDIIQRINRLENSITNVKEEVKEDIQSVKENIQEDLESDDIININE